MHELSVALEVCRITETHVGRDRLADVLSVTVEVGRDSCLEPANLEFCLEALLSHPPFRRGRPVIRLAPGDDLRVLSLEIEDDGPDD